MGLQAILRLQFESPRVTMLLCQIYLLLSCDAAASHLLSLAERANPGVAESCDLVLDCVSQNGDAMWLCPVSERGTEAKCNQMARATGEMHDVGLLLVAQQPGVGRSVSKRSRCN
jgi:hypothetical protein